MKVIMTGGGTGGHIYPAIAIADKIKRKNPDAEILFVGTKRGMERELVPQNGYDIQFITVSGFHRKQLWKNAKTLIDLVKGNRQAAAIIKDFRPDVVIGTGGYVCGPVVRAAKKKGIKTYVHEQNAFPGVTNKILEKYVDKVFLSFEESRKYFKNPSKLIVTGNPIRKSFLVANPERSREKLGADANDFVVLCFGGSLGAEKINRSLIGSLKEFAEVENLKVIFITGKRHYGSVMEEITLRGIKIPEQVSIIEYANNMPEYLAAADLIVGRAGALTISEITACGKASVLIPSPYVTGNHQFHNAKVVSDQGGAILLEEKDLNEKSLFTTIMRLKNHKGLINRMAEASLKIGKLDAVDMIYDHLDL